MWCDVHMQWMFTCACMPINWYMWEYVCLTVDLTIILTIPSLGLLFTCHFSLIVVLVWIHSPSLSFKTWSCIYRPPPSRERSQQRGSDNGGEWMGALCMCGVCWYNALPLNEWTDMLIYLFIIYLLVFNNVMHSFAINIWMRCAYAMNACSAFACTCILMNRYVGLCQFECWSYYYSFNPLVFSSHVTFLWLLY